MQLSLHLPPNTTDLSKDVLSSQHCTSKQWITYWKASSSQKIHQRCLPTFPISVSLINPTQYQLPKLYFNGRAKPCLNHSVSGLWLWMKAEGLPCSCENLEGMQCMDLSRSWGSGQPSEYTCTWHIYRAVNPLNKRRVPASSNSQLNI